MAERPEIESVALVTGAMAQPGERFHLPALESAGIRVLAAVGGDQPLDDPAEALFGLLPRPIAALARGWYGVFRAERPAVVHAWQDATSVATGFAALAAGVPTILLAGRNLSPLNFIYWRPFLRPSYRVLARQKSVGMLNNSMAGARDYSAWLGLPVDRFAVLRNGFAAETLARSGMEAVKATRRALGIPDGAPVIGSVFRFYPEKRPALWLDMAAIVARRIPEAHFVLVGWGPQTALVERRTRQLGLGERLHLVAATPEIAPLLSMMDAFVLTSLLEGTPNVLIEAQALGIPVVATPGGGTAEALEAGVTGWLASSDSAAELADLVVALLTDPKRRTIAAARGPAFVAERFGMLRMIEETLALYGLGGRTR